MNELLLAAAPAAGGSIWGMVLSFGAMFAVFYFLLIRPQQKKQKTRNAMLGALKKGDKIVTIGGLHGHILEITDDIVVIRVNDVTKMTFDRNAISHIISTGSTEEAAKA
ncbi:preprotein translocase subunit YajC [Paenibacillus agilis]|uniref:Preprotein translocase subunit YajC n=1 Tax=Paenibacillus agilis TaxID=3020863 RepID=A0A559J3M0_9BACL|nr:preprotein translocase subunit YajC [Paenibacillus agilis]TVX94490.1 preprotein translocase subunit YajC [Paenibacillus agilis]